MRMRREFIIDSAYLFNNRVEFHPKSNLIDNWGSSLFSEGRWMKTHIKAPRIGKLGQLTSSHLKGRSVMPMKTSPIMQFSAYGTVLETWDKNQSRKKSPLIERGIREASHGGRVYHVGGLNYLRYAILRSLCSGRFHFRRRRGLSVPNRFIRLMGGKRCHI